MWFLPQDKKDNKKTPQNTVNLQTSTIKQDSEDERDRHLMFCFRVVSPGKVYLLQAENGLERKEWMQCIQVCASDPAAPGLLFMHPGSLACLATIPGYLQRVPWCCTIGSFSTVMSGSALQRAVR